MNNVSRRRRATGRILAALASLSLVLAVGPTVFFRVFHLQADLRLSATLREGATEANYGVLQPWWTSVTDAVPPVPTSSEDVARLQELVDVFRDRRRAPHHRGPGSVATLNLYTADGMSDFLLAPGPDPNLYELVWGGATFHVRRDAFVAAMERNGLGPVPLDHTRPP